MHKVVDASPEEMMILIKNMIMIDLILIKTRHVKICTAYSSECTLGLILNHNGNWFMIHMWGIDYIIIIL